MKEVLLTVLIFARGHTLAVAAEILRGNRHVVCVSLDEVKHTRKIPCVQVLAIRVRRSAMRRPGGKFVEKSSEVWSVKQRRPELRISHSSGRSQGGAKGPLFG